MKKLAVFLVLLLACGPATRSNHDQVLGWGITYPSVARDIDRLELRETTRITLHKATALYKQAPGQGHVVWVNSILELQHLWVFAAQRGHKVIPLTGTAAYDETEQTIIIVRGPRNVSEPRGYLGHAVTHHMFGDYSHHNPDWRNWDIEFNILETILFNQR
jgi:hypothetical protein